METIIIFVGTAYELFDRPIYVASVDHSLPPEQSVTLTANREEAKRFADAGEALEAWRGINQVVPVRADGEPNRPMTAYTVAFEKP